MLGSALTYQIWNPVLACAFLCPSVSDLVFAEFDSIHPIDVAGISRDCLFCNYASGYYQLTRSTMNLFHANPLRLDQ